MVHGMVGASGASGDNGLFLALVLGFVPSAAWLAFFWTRDRYEREPKSLIVKLFLIGAIPVFVGAFIVNTLLAAIVGGVAMAFFGAPIIEESLKFLGYSSATRKSSQLNELVDGMIYGSAVG